MDVSASVLTQMVSRVESGSVEVRAHFSSVMQPFTTETQLIMTTIAHPPSPMKNSVSTARIAKRLI